jgi:hypothetical protein
MWSALPREHVSEDLLVERPWAWNRFACRFPNRLLKSSMKPGRKPLPGIHSADTLQPQLLHQSILQRRVHPLDPTLGLRVLAQMMSMLSSATARQELGDAVLASRGPPWGGLLFELRGSTLQRYCSPIGQSFPPASPVRQKTTRR